MASFGTSKKRRKKIGRPTDLEMIFKNLDQSLVQTMGMAASDLPVAYKTIQDAMVAKDSSPTNRVSAAKWIIDFGKGAFEALYQQVVEEAEAAEAAEAEKIASLMAEAEPVVEEDVIAGEKPLEEEVKEEEKPFKLDWSTWPSQPNSVN